MATKSRRKVFLFSKYMLFGPKSQFLLPIRQPFNTISMLGTNMYYIGELRTHNGTIQYKILCIIIHYVTTRTHGLIV